jgi:hypothetical protein
MKELQLQIESGSIQMDGNFFLDVEGQTEKAVKVHYLGKLHWMPKSVFQPKIFAGLTVFGIKQWMIDKITSKY